MCKKALNLLGIARKGGNMAIGEEPVGVAAHGGKARLIILASDAADHTRRRARSYGSLHNTPVISIDADKAQLGAMFGRSAVAMAAVTEIKLAKSFLEALSDPDRYAAALAAVTEKAETMALRKQKKPGRREQVKR